MVEIKWSDQSLKGIDDIAEFISKDSAKYAKIQVQLFFEKVKVLCDNPEIGRIVPELNKKKIRELLIGNYRIVYRNISFRRIDILTIHHSKRLLSNNPSIKRIKKR